MLTNASGMSKQGNFKQISAIVPCLAFLRCHASLIDKNPINKQTIGYENTQSPCTNQESEKKIP